MNTRSSAFGILRRLMQSRIPARSDTPAPSPMLEPWLQSEEGVGIDTEGGHLGAMVIEVEDA